MKNIIIIFIFLALAGAGYWYFKKRKNTTEDLPVVDPDDGQKKDVTPKSNKCVFPLQKGVKCDKIKVLQNAMIKKIGKNILPKFGADGSYGNELQTALNKLGIDNILIQNGISEKIYNTLLNKL